MNDKMRDFDGDEAVANEYSNVKTCPKSDSGYHCSCYDKDGKCCICMGDEVDATEQGNDRTS